MFRFSTIGAGAFASSLGFSLDLKYPWASVTKIAPNKPIAITFFQRLCLLFSSNSFISSVNPKDVLVLLNLSASCPLISWTFVPKLFLFPSPNSFTSMANLFISSSLLSPANKSATSKPVILDICANFSIFVFTLPVIGLIILLISFSDNPFSFNLFTITL